MRNPLKYQINLRAYFCKNLQGKITTLKKSYTKTGEKCRVTFKLPADVNADSALLVGEFNKWDFDANPMKKLKNGDFSATLSLQAGQSYRFRYLLDNERWENDWAPDGYLPNEFGSDDSIVEI
ncbi:MAG: isoamylase early set domain-containing protein [Chloroflexota bacterium]